ncbi:peptide chain release factor N(5)-glutamine methyltransferase, partial [Patescibacteria group bacterium]|nr:peptide chain release factor N(5)-glutamine methyltransferase [Patescibacteria group bacterium]
MKSTTIKNSLNEATRELSSSTSPELDAELLLAHALNISTEKMIASLDQEIEATHLSTFLALVEKRKQGTPIAYLIGYKEFFGYQIKVTPDVLIPRPETETILEHAIKSIQNHLPKKTNLALADIGTGSGEIALVLSKAFPKAKILASDISSQALKVAK